MERNRQFAGPSMKVKLDKRKLESGSVSNTPKKTYMVQEAEDRFEVEGLDQITTTQIISRKPGIIII